MANSVFTWKDAPDLMAALVAAQNSPANTDLDIVTFAGFCESRDELVAHLCRYEIRAQNWAADHAEAV